MLLEEVHVRQKNWSRKFHKEGVSQEAGEPWQVLPTMVGGGQRPQKSWEGQPDKTRAWAPGRERKELLGETFRRQVP